MSSNLNLPLVITLLHATLLLSACSPVKTPPSTSPIPLATPVLTASLPQLVDDSSPPGAEFEFNTDFSKHTVPLQRYSLRWTL